MSLARIDRRSLNRPGGVALHRRLYQHVGRKPVLQARNGCRARTAGQCGPQHLCPQDGPFDVGASAGFLEGVGNLRAVRGALTLPYNRCCMILCARRARDRAREGWRVRPVKPLVVSAIVMVVLASGCTTRVAPFEAEVVVPAVKVKPEADGGFCPPGQAKKRRCRRGSHAAASDDPNPRRRHPRTRQPIISRL